jgi:hypothetical protein
MDKYPYEKISRGQWWFWVEQGRTLNVSMVNICTHISCCDLFLKQGKTTFILSLRKQQALKLLHHNNYLFGHPLSASASLLHHSRIVVIFSCWWAASRLVQPYCYPESFHRLASVASNSFSTRFGLLLCLRLLFLALHLCLGLCTQIASLLPIIFSS